MALIGAVLVAIGPFMPWVKLGRLSADGLQKTDNEALILVVAGVIGALVAVGGLANKKRASGGGLAILGLLSGALAIFYFVQLQDQLSGINIGAPSVGAGLYACLIGSVLMLVGGLVERGKGAS